MAARDTTDSRATADGIESPLRLEREIVGEPETIAYIRGSGMAPELGLSASRARIHRYAEERGWTPAFLEDVGRAGGHRPGFDALVRAVEHGAVQRVLFVAGHHLARDQGQLLEFRQLLRERGIALINVAARPDSEVSPTSSSTSEMDLATDNWAVELRRRTARR